MIQVQARESFILDPLVLLIDGANTASLELHPLQPRHGYQTETIGSPQCLDDRFHHGQKRDVEGRDGSPCAPSVPHASVGRKYFHRISVSGRMRVGVILVPGVAFSQDVEAAEPVPI
jgi:hypothetical protein